MMQTNGRIGHRSRLLVVFATLIVSLAFAAQTAPAAGPHGPYSTVADECAACHRAHTSSSASILNRAAPQSTLCFTCHDGSGADSNVMAEYTDGAVPANNPSTRDYYSHDAIVVTSHTQSRLNEFGGVSNRHTECGDCHNAHAANTADGTETTSGWTASGRLASVSGVSVVNGAADSSPTYTFRDGDVPDLVDREYELCFKCHSGFTTLASNSGFTPSKYVLDKGVEFNPANASYHPVEAPGKNATAEMAASLAASSPFKQWNFTTSSTIRCSNCHASANRYNEATPPVAGASLPPHTSQYRGILLRNYRDRVLKSSTEAYSAADFALCFMCHGDAPFSTSTSSATNFPFHDDHVTDIQSTGWGGTDIDTPGAGQGNAICAECHYRLHSTTYKVGAQTVDGSRLVNFAPNVEPYLGTRAWVGNSCTLTCHGVPHDNLEY